MRTLKVITATFLFVALCNLPPMNFLMRLITGDSIVPGVSENMYITADLKYVYQGDLADLSSNRCYKEYCSTSGNNILYRIQKIEIWKFWRWADYLLDEKWRQPYLPLSLSDLKKAMYESSQHYGARDGTLRCR